AQGCAAIFEGGKPLKMKQSKNHAFCFACSEKSRMGLFRASLTAKNYVQQSANPRQRGFAPAGGQRMGSRALWMTARTERSSPRTV
ncbi:MAG: hypothetical protein ACT4NU_05390, partial [Chromatiales bacterium]